MMGSETFVWALGCAAAAGIVVAVAGGLLTETGAWYAGLRKPGWKPPDWAFGPVWTVIIILAVIAAALAWEAASSPAARAAILVSLVINSVLNVAWSGFFFKLRRPDWALIEVALLWLSIVLLVVVLGAASSTAGWLLLPYLAWVSVAAFLNYRIVQLNKPFA
ncbi:MAG: TspO/MBR family protein [Aestuariivirga sp.]|uniref:TspO/MBR family protein n=1 Tax=Aestuariivirga sp. TaxID=2650926 RepID=UPI0038D1FC8A